MKDLDIFNLLQTVFIGFGVIVSIMTLIIAYRIGTRQNEINEKSLGLSDFSEIFLMPQSILKIENNTQILDHFNVIVKNVSSYPIYLNSFTLNGVKTDIGSSAIPNNTDSWYAIIIPKDAQDKGEFSLIIEFETYLNKKYRNEGFGKFENGGWNIRTNKSVEVQ